MDTEAHAAEGSPATEISMWLRMLFRQHRRRLLIAASELELHPAQAGALLQLGSPLPMRELAGLLGCDSSNVTGLIDRLETRGLVSREPDVQDRRVKHVVLTPGGERLRDEQVRRTAPRLPGLERLSDAEQRQLRDLLLRALVEDELA
jgi:DNA-binding MarR family transcriptional regulator